ncbi:hypothetical protein JHK84_048179 [Glycine max]|nr:hypothetical protein JHK85_048772 [Glycine max]KAG5103210.1 hypothetical protein JHK84_048179 [Glycine max]
MLKDLNKGFELTKFMEKDGMGPSVLALTKSTKGERKASSDGARLMLLVESGRIVCEAKLVDDIFQVLRPYKVVPAIALDKTGLAAVGVRFQSLSNLGSRLPSPSKTSVMSSCSSRGVSPSQSRPSIPPRRASPSRMRPSNSSNQSNNAFSVLNKMLALHIEKLCLIVYATLS